MAPSTPKRTSVDLAADDVGSPKCLYFPPAALAGIALPKRLVVEGPAGRRQVAGCTARSGAKDETVVLAAPSFCESVAPGSATEIHVAVLVSRARWYDVLRSLGAWTILKLIGAVVAFCGSVAGGIVAFTASKAALGIAALVLVGVAFAALLQLNRSIGEALDFGC
jgi:hypothetical protein